MVFFANVTGNTGMQPEIFRGRRGFMELGHISLKTKEKKCHARKNFGVFSRKDS